MQHGSSPLALSVLCSMRSLEGKELDEECFIVTLELMIDDIVCNSNGKADTSCIVQTRMYFETLSNSKKKSSNQLLLSVSRFEPGNHFPTTDYAERSDLN